MEKTGKEKIDRLEDSATFDDIPNVELNHKVKDERNKDKTKDTSSSEEERVDEN
ncbi:hypothetical protein [Ureibacillus sinduriensis]|uniref:hypothetical protein n=1 Tax=Ureibacillus sinduriensis TaxID=561440 RepID=UPI000A45B01D|nr:hypothetical protein [Ureibacillus sinduriensis]